MGIDRRGVFAALAGATALGAASEARVGAMRACVAPSQGSHAIWAARTHNANGLLASRNCPKASNDGTAWRWIEICSASAEGDLR